MKGKHLIVNAKQFLDVEQNKKIKNPRKEHYNAFPSSFIKACKQRFLVCKNLEMNN